MAEPRQPRVLLDSNVCIYLIEGLSEAARHRVEGFAPGEVVTSAIAFAEVMLRVDEADPKASANARAFFSEIPVLPFDAEAALSYRHVPFERHRFDHLIAAHALSLDLLLVTRNTRHFGNVPGLRVENWICS
jgi:tRNA(fMet)-specific endonuclease VapC